MGFLFVSLSIRLFLTRWCCTKTVKHIIKQSTTRVNLRTLIYTKRLSEIVTRGAKTAKNKMR